MYNPENDPNSEERKEEERINKAIKKGNRSTNLIMFGVYSIFIMGAGCFLYFQGQKNIEMTNNASTIKGTVAEERYLRTPDRSDEYLVSIKTSDGRKIGVSFDEGRSICKDHPQYLDTLFNVGDSVELKVVSPVKTNDYNMGIEGKLAK